jgi:hypothetical protein
MLCRSLHNRDFTRLKTREQDPIFGNLGSRGGMACSPFTISMRPWNLSTKTCLPKAASMPPCRPTPGVPIDGTGSRSVIAPVHGCVAPKAGAMDAQFCGKTRTAPQPPCRFSVLFGLSVRLANPKKCVTNKTTAIFCQPKILRCT